MTAFGRAQAASAGVLRHVTASGPGASGAVGLAGAAAFPLLQQQPNLPPRVRALLVGMQQLATAHFDEVLRDTLDAIEQALVARVDLPSSGARGRFADMHELRGQRTNITLRFLRHVESSLAHVRAGTAATAAPMAILSLELVDEVALDEDLTLQEIAGKAEIRHRYALHALAHRFGVLAGSPIWSNATLPLGPSQLNAAFRHALQDLAFGVEQRVLAYREFERGVVTSIDALYERINGYLVAQRVLPSLDLLGAGARESQAPAQRATTPAAPSPIARSAPAPTPAAARAPEDAALPATLRRLLGERRQRADAPAQGPLATREELQAVLAGMQRRHVPAARFDGEHFRNTLMVKLRRAGSDGAVPNLAGADADTIDLIGLLFDYLTRNARESGTARELLTRLHIPLLRVALVDESFFSLREHPVRELLGMVADAAARWADESDLDADMLVQVHAAIDAIGTAADAGRSRLDAALGELGRHLQMLARRAEAAERRHVEAARGRDKLAVAREEARAAIARLLRESTPASAVRCLLEQAWTDALALSALRGGSAGDEFRRRVAVADQLVQRGGGLRMSVDAAVRSELDAGLRQVGLHDDDVREVLDCLLSVRGASASDAATIARALQRKARLGGGASTPVAVTATPAPAPGSAEAASLDELRRTPAATWFDFSVGARVVRRKLAWCSATADDCVFVNQRGLRCEDRAMPQLAREIVAGSVRRVDDGQVSLADRAWRAIADTLRAQSAARSERRP